MFSLVVRMAAKGMVVSGAVTVPKLVTATMQMRMLNSLVSEGPIISMEEIDKAINVLRYGSGGQSHRLSGDEIKAAIEAAGGAKFLRTYLMCGYEACEDLHDKIDLSTTIQILDAVTLKSEVSRGASATAIAWRVELYESMHQNIIAEDRDQYMTPAGE